MTSDWNASLERLVVVTGERFTALEVIGPEKFREVERDAAYGLGGENKEPEVWEQKQLPIQQVGNVCAPNQIWHDLEILPFAPKLPCLTAFVLAL